MTSKVAIVACDNYDRDTIERSVCKAIDYLGGITQFVKPGGNVLIKPNLCLPELPEKCYTSHPEIIRTLANLCNEAGTKVVVGDSPVGDADRTRLNYIWEQTGIAAALHGIRYERSFIDRNMTPFHSNIKEREYSFYVSQEVLSMDLIINVPKFKTHSLMTFTGAVKNLYGLLPGNSKKKLHSELPEHEDFASLLVDIYQRIRPGLNIMDAVIGIEGNGPGTQGVKKKIGLIMASNDAIALDSVCAKLMNLEPQYIHTNRIGALKGFGEMNIGSIEMLGEPIEKFIMKDFILPVTFRYRPDITHRIFSLSRTYMKIEQGKCKACGLCSLNCPAMSIIMKDGFAQIDQETCISCMTCHEICPEGAVYPERSSFYKQLRKLKFKKNNIEI